MGARVYDPYVGRFTSVDPIPGGSANNYDYCGQDPINNVDLAGTRLEYDNGGGYTPPKKRRPKAMSTTTGGPSTLRPDPRPQAAPSPCHSHCAGGISWSGIGWGLLDIAQSGVLFAGGFACSDATLGIGAPICFGLTGSTEATLTVAEAKLRDPHASPRQFLEEVGVVGIRVNARLLHTVIEFR
jgi:hypothetical protein